MPCSHSHITNLGVWCPRKACPAPGTDAVEAYPHRSSARSVSPPAIVADFAWVSSGLSSGGGGSRARIWVNSCCNHSCKTALGQVVTPLTRTFPVGGTRLAAWQSRSSLIHEAVYLVLLLVANGIQDREWSDRVPLHLASRRATPLARLRCKPAR